MGGPRAACQTSFIIAGPAGSEALPVQLVEVVGPDRNRTCRTHGKCNHDTIAL